MVFKKLYFVLAALSASRSLIFCRLTGLDADDAKVADLTIALETKLDVYEEILSTQKYVAGNVSDTFLRESFLVILWSRKFRWLTCSTPRTVLWCRNSIPS